jgi:hypothetical protein
VQSLDLAGDWPWAVCDALLLSLASCGSSPPGLRAGKGVYLGEQIPGLGCADPLEYLQCLPQQGLGLRGVAVGHGAAAQAGQGMSLIPGTADGPGQFQSLQVTFLSLREFTPGPVQRPL